MDLQILHLTGNAVRPAELVEAKNGKKFLSFDLAANRYLGKDLEPEAAYYQCLLFAPKKAEELVKKIKKGTRLLVRGRPTAEAYLNKKSEPQASLKVILSKVDVLE